MDHIQYIGYSAAIVTSIFGIFEILQKSYDKKTNLGKDLKDKTLSTLLRKLPKLISNLFDNWFGMHHYSWHCFRRTSLVSLCGVIISAPVFMWITSFEPDSSIFHYKNLGLSATSVFYRICFVVPTTIIINIFTDYISFFETRAIVRAGNSNFSQRYWLIAFPMLALADYMLSLAILIFMVILTFQFFDLVQNWIGGFLIEIVHTSGIAGSSHDPILGLLLFSCVFTTMLSTLFAMLFSLAAFSMYLFALALKPFEFISQYLDIENLPFRVLGFNVAALAALVCLAVWIILFIRSAFV